MAFWKKSEDPWDVDPARERERREPIENPLDTLKDWSEGRRVKAAARQAEWDAQPKEACPWCGKEMERGCLQAGRPGIYWNPGRPSALSFWLAPGAFEESVRVDDEDEPLKGTYKTAWYCRDCGKVAFSLPPKAGDSPSGHQGPEDGVRDAGEEDPS